MSDNKVEPLSAEEVEKAMMHLAFIHQEYSPQAGVCKSCGQDWPCATTKLLISSESLRSTIGAQGQEIERLKREVLASEAVYTGEIAAKDAILRECAKTLMTAAGAVELRRQWGARYDECIALAAKCEAALGEE
jgi:hypothetical protein